MNRTTAAAWIILASLALNRSATGQEISGVLSESAYPSVPYLVEPVMPEAAIRLQIHVLPITLDAPGSLEDYVLLPMRVVGSFPFSERIIGEASMPVFLNFPPGGDPSFEFGNPRIGMEAPLLEAGGKNHQWTFGFDVFLPLAQVGEPEEGEDEHDAIQRRTRYGLMTGALPHMSPDFAMERIGVVVGTHYRLRLQKCIAQAGVDFPFLIGFDLDGERLFDDGEILVRYGLMAGYDVRPVYPTLELVGITQISGETDSWTALMANAGIRYAVRGFEPGLSVTLPLMMGDDLIDNSVYFNVELAYRFR